MNDIDKIIKKYGADILKHKNMIGSKKYIHHGNTSIYSHSLDVTRLCLKLAIKFKLKIDVKSLVRGSLLHDYFLYDWHVKDKSHRLHGFKHATFALNNAIMDFDLNQIEKNMIYTHMFPLNIRIPKYKESWILILSDKICALKEVFKRKKFKKDKIGV